NYWILRRFDSLSQWSFIFAVIALVYYVVEPVIEIVL
ncbi:MFS transporter permease, partial [Vibrio parahaemolyticus]